MVKVKKFEVFSFAKLQAVVFALLGVLAGIAYSFGGLVIDTLVSIGWITSAATPGLSCGTVLAFGALIGMPIIFAAFGFAAGLIGAFLYNVLAKRFGGIHVDLDLEEDVKEKL